MMINEELKIEVTKYIESIEENINKSEIEDISLKEIQNTYTSIIGIVNIGGYTVVGDTILQLITVFDGIMSERYEFTSEHLTLMLITNEYIKEMLEKTPDELKFFSTENINKAFQDIASELTVDIKDIYIKDIIRNKIKKRVNNEIIFNDSEDVKIPISRIDKMITGINDLILNQYQLKTKLSEINRLKEIIRTVQDSGFTPEVERALRNFGTIETEIDNQLLKFEGTALKLQDEVLSMRMLPLSLIKDQLEVLISNEAKRNNKNVRAFIDMENILIDKIILQSIEHPIYNLIKNSIEHGIESSGTIYIKCSYDKGKINLIVGDDGQGVDYSRIRKKVMELFPFEKSKISELEDKELNEYLFLEGVTLVDGDSARGFGLAEVHTRINQIKGKLIFTSSSNGVEVNITVPKSLTTIFGYYIRCAGEKLFVPSSFINEIITAKRSDVIDLVSKQAIKLRNDVIPIYPLSGILDDRTSIEREKMFILIIKIYGESIGIIVDEILYHASAIFKRLPGCIENMKELQGVVFDEEFKVINILYIPIIVNRLKAIRNIEFKERYSQEKEKYKKILVVDDSSVNREIIEKILIRENFRVSTACNGIEALEKIREDSYQLIITDSYMPRMDGKTFVENLRKEAEYKKTPVIAILSGEGESGGFKSENGIVSFIRAQFNRDQFVKNIKELLGVTY